MSLIVLAAACGGKQKKTEPPPPLPEPKPAEEAKPAEPAEKPAEPPPPQPLEVTLPSPEVKVKLVSAGKGAKTALKLTPKAGAKQQVELALDFAGKTTGMPEGDTNDIMPTLVLTGDTEVKAVDKDGAAEFQLTVVGTDARDVAGQKAPTDQIKTVLASIQGMTIGGTINANGTPSGEFKIRIEKGTPMAAGALQLVVLAFPSLPVLPKEPVGVGAKWQVTTQAKLADQLSVTRTTDYQVVSKKGTTWTIKGTTKVTGADQDLQGAKATKIGGTGSVDATIADGVLYPTLKAGMQTGFTVSGKDPGTQKDVNGTLEIKQAATITPKS